MILFILSCGHKLEILLICCSSFGSSRSETWAGDYLRKLGLNLLCVVEVNWLEEEPERGLAMSTL